MSDWQEKHEGLLGKNRSTITFGLENPTKEDWTLWRRELSKIHTPDFKLLSPLDRWIHPSARVWRYYYDKNKARSKQSRKAARKYTLGWTGKADGTLTHTGSEERQ